ncbi:MAG: AAA family ATPase [Candidatus Dormiibacterota bacterium]
MNSYHPRALGGTTDEGVDMLEARRPGLPRMLVLTTGPPGAGKTTLARQVAGGLGAPAALQGHGQRATLRHSRGPRPRLVDEAGSRR